MAKRNSPIILGAGEKPNKVAVGIKSISGLGYDVMILGLRGKSDYENGDSEEALIEALDGKEYATLRFCKMEALDAFIKCLQGTKKLWEKEMEKEKQGN